MIWKRVGMFSCSRNLSACDWPHGPGGLPSYALFHRGVGRDDRFSASIVGMKNSTKNDVKLTAIFGGREGYLPHSSSGPPSHLRCSMKLISPWQFLLLITWNLHAKLVLWLVWRKPLRRITAQMQLYIIYFKKTALWVFFHWWQKILLNQLININLFFNIKKELILALWCEDNRNNKSYQQQNTRRNKWKKQHRNNSRMELDVLSTFVGLMESTSWKDLGGRASCSWVIL